MSDKLNATQLQISHQTGPNRYPEIFAAAQKVHPEARKILSFGSSYGDEAATLRGFFPNAEIIGLDVVDEVIAASAEKYGDMGITFDHSRSIDDYAPFDLIFAMSVLCVWPKSKRRGSLKKIFPYEEFCTRVSELDRVLEIGGLFVIHNANYRFEDTKTCWRYEDISEPGLPEGIVHKFGKGSIKLKDHSGGILFRKLRDEWVRGAQKT